MSIAKKDNHSTSQKSDMWNEFSSYFDLPKNEFGTLADASSGIAVYGGVGAGKTSASGIAINTTQDDSDKEVDSCVP